MERTSRPRVSIVVPCYNCDKTLAEAVASCFTQNITDLEIIMVDDGSSDGTSTIMHSLAAKHPEVRIICHEANRGGGAARNTGIQAATGTLIYCLDSDNVFAPNTIGRMADFLVTKRLDGVAFNERRFFSGDKMGTYTSQHNKVVDRPIALEDLFNDNDILLDNFLYTKESYLRTGGYPEHHGFDTQTFEILWLAAGNSVSICPDTAFYHRQAQKGHKSYFEREYEKGLFSINTFLALEPAIDLLDDSAIELCLGFDVLSKNRFGEGRNLLAALKSHVKAGKTLRITAKRSRYAERFVDASISLRDGRYPDALASVAECEKEHGSITPLLFVTMVRILAGMKGFEGKQREDEMVRWLSERGLLSPQKMRWLPSPILRLHSALRSLISKIKHE